MTRHCNSKGWALVARAAVIFLFVASRALVLGDGFYVPPSAVPVPGIPSQTACIVFHDGTETLIVESQAQVDAAGEYAWIIPIPAVPAEMKAVEPGLMDTLRFFYGPRVQTIDHLGFGWSIFFVLSSLILTHGLMTKSQRSIELVLVLLIMAGLSFMAVPSFLGVGGDSISDSQIARIRQRVGNYDVAVLQARDHKELAAWLNKNGFAALATDANSTIDSYAKDGWVFVTARMAMGEAGRMAPHPLALTFSASRPVYPMRLTAISGAETQVDLFVVSDSPWSSASLNTWIRLPLETRGESIAGADKDAPSVYPVDYPTLRSLVPKRFWLTRLHGVLTPDQMRAGDILLDTAPQTPRQQVFHTREVIRRSFLACMFWTLALGMPIGGLLCRREDRKIESHHFLLITSIPLLVGCCAGFLATSGMTRQEGFVIKPGLSVASQYSRATWAIQDAASKAAQKGDDAAKARASILQSATNAFTGGPIHEEESPGNFRVREAPDGTWSLEVYGRYGTVTEHSSEHLRRK